jgi:hypothetical protein
MKPRTAAITAQGHRTHQDQLKTSREYDQNISRAVGRIRKLDAYENGKMYVLVDVPDSNGNFRAFGQDKVPIVIIDTPLDLLLRFGGLEVGQMVELFYRGTGENAEASARVIGAAEEELTSAKKAPREGFLTASSLPFEPSGII